MHSHLQTVGQMLIDQQLRNPHNATVYTLADDIHLEAATGSALVALKQTQFINLAPEYQMAKVAMALYAGDGIVTKLTPEGWISREPFPYVLPPFASRNATHSFRFPGKDHNTIVIENYPLLATKDITEGDVLVMKHKLKAVGLEFNDGDDRPDNLGRLSNGDLVVLDGNAVSRIAGKGKSDELQEALRLWQKKIQALYPTLYASIPPFHYQQTPSTTFDFAPYHDPLVRENVGWARAKK